MDHQLPAELLEPAAFGELAQFDGREAELLDQAGDLGVGLRVIARQEKDTPPPILVRNLGQEGRGKTARPG